MSETYSIGCRDCKVHLWVGQALAGHTMLYHGSMAVLALEEFLFAHQNHNLTFGNNCDGVFIEDGWKEIEI